MMLDLFIPVIYINIVYAALSISLADCISALLINAKSGALLSEKTAKRSFAAHKVTKIKIYKALQLP